MNEKSRVYGYCRCSTNESKQDVEYQIKELVEKGIKKEDIYFEYQSGSREDRPILSRILKDMVKGDSLYVTDITRLSRSTKQLCSIIDFINTNKMRLVIGSLDVDCRSDNIEPMVEGMLKMMAVFAELDRKMKVYQINLGLKNAVKSGKTLGRPKTTKEDIPDLFYKYYPMYKNNQINKKEFSRLSKLSYPSIYKYISIVEKR
ncbi:MAG: recombinase family protein [Clostridium sp.]|nr:recombinase family protein [Clostridium sp.]